MTVTRTDFHKILKVLVEEQVEFIVVGGVCAVLHGAPVTTFDLGLVHARDPENIQRLIKALQRLDARCRATGHRVLRPQTDRLKTGGHQLLLTAAGPLDLLGEIGAGRGFVELLDHAEKCRLGPDLTIRLLKLEMLIRSKEEAAREKDHAVLAILRRTLAEKRKQD